MTDTNHTADELTPTGDRERLNERASLKRRLWRRLYVRPGTVVWDPSFGEGFVDFVDDVLTPTLLSRMAVDARVGILKDGEVKVVQAESYESQSGRAIIVLKGRTVDGNDFNLNMVF